METHCAYTAPIALYSGTVSDATQIGSDGGYPRVCPWPHLGDYEYYSREFTLRVIGTPTPMPSPGASVAATPTPTPTPGDSTGTGTGGTSVGTAATGTTGTDGTTGGTGTATAGGTGGAPSPTPEPSAAPSPQASPGVSPEPSPAASPASSPAGSPTSSPGASPVSSPLASPASSPVASPASSPKLDDKGTSKRDPKIGDGDCPTEGITSWDVHAMVVALTLQDTPVGVTSGSFSLPFTLNYSHRETGQPDTFTYTNFGPKWTCNWIGILTDETTTLGTATLYERGGGRETFTFPPGADTSAPGPMSQSIITKSATGFTRTFSDGSSERYARSDSNRYFLTSSSDPQGNVVILGYDDSNRLASLTDPVGRVTTLTYGLPTDPLKVTKVTDPYGRSAQFTYSGGRLASIQDTIGIVSSYSYGPGDFIKRLTTPYGSTYFNFGDRTTDPSLGDRRFLEVTDPMGRKSRVESRDRAPGVPGSDAVVPEGMPVGNTDLDLRNTFFWNPQQLAEATAGGGLDYTKARVYHFLKRADGGTSRILESVKNPLENRVWYSYPGQTAGPQVVGTTSQPSAVGRKLSDGTTQRVAFQYNGQGNVISRTDPAGRVFIYSYKSNGIDLESVRTSNLTLMSASYDARHLPLTVTDAAGASTTVSYTARGLVDTVKNALGDVTRFSYDNRENLTFIHAPMGAQTSFDYDNFDRAWSITDSGGLTVEASYDTLDRPTEVRYPNGTKEQVGYTLLDRTSYTDARGQVTRYHHNANRELSRVTDAKGDSVTYDYRHYSSPDSVTDANGHTTTWVRDLQGRPITKHFADGTSSHFTYELCRGRLRSATDALNQKTIYRYNLDDTLASVNYSGGTRPAPNVQFEYDTVLPRVLRMIDGVGTTSMTYKSAGDPGALQVATVSGPYPGDQASFNYDALGRVRNRTVNGVSQSWTFDALGRVTGENNALDAFIFTYLGPTGQLTGVRSSSGPTLQYTYAPNSQLRRLARIANLTGGNRPSLLSSFEYDYDANGRIESIEQGGPSVGQGKPDYAMLGPDQPQASLLLAALKSPLAGASRGWPVGLLFQLLVLAATFLAMLLQFMLMWGTLPRRRRARRLVAVGIIGAVLSGCGGVGTATSSGSEGSSTESVLGKSGSPTVKTDFKYDPIGQLLEVTSGQRPLTKFDYDPAGNILAKKGGPGSAQFGYDSVNNQVSPAIDSDSIGQVDKLKGARLEWDSAGRLVALERGQGGDDDDDDCDDDEHRHRDRRDRDDDDDGRHEDRDRSRSEFTYDGLGRRVRIVEKKGHKVVSDKRYFWVGGAIVTERDTLRSGSPVTKRYFPQGVKDGGKSLYYTFDHLGSVRELVDSTGKVRAAYRYSAYGRRDKVAGDLEADWGFAGLWHHEPSGLELATYRAYDATRGRWLSRDPLGEAAGLNMLAYCGGDPINLIDPPGLETYIYFTDGTHSIVSSGTEFLHAAQSAGGSKLITDIVTRGHGGSLVADLSGTSDSDSLSAASARGVQLQYTENGSNKTKFVALKDVLKGKLSGGARFFLNNCSTAAGDENLTKAISSDFAGHEVRGVTGTLNEYGNLHGLTGYSDSPGKDSSFQYYVNGAPIASPVGGIMEPFTHFWQQSTTR